MQRYLVEAVIESPLVIRRERQSQRSEGSETLSGTLVRGALAQAYLQHLGPADAPAFVHAFLDEEACRFGAWTPAEQTLPLTAHTCKRHPGFEADGGHGVVDLLADLIRDRIRGERGPARKCPQCAADLKPISGYWHDGPRPVHRRTGRMAMAMHVGIDRATVTAAPAVLYSLPTLEPDEPTPTLRGWIDADDAAIATIRQLLEAAGGVVRIGHARSRGYGRVRVRLGPTPAAIADDPQRWEQWSAALLARIAGPAYDPQQFWLFSVSLPAGAIVLDEVLRYSLDPASMVPWLPPIATSGFDKPALQRPAWEYEGGRLWWVAAHAGHERLRGWHIAHGLPRADEWLVSRGSVYAYLFQGPADARSSLQQRLLQLQQQGIGARRNEGYGQVRICDEFHRRLAYQENR